jgi:hypothetical protein
MGRAVTETRERAPRVTRTQNSGRRPRSEMANAAKWAEQEWQPARTMSGRDRAVVGGASR